MAARERVKPPGRDVGVTEVLGSWEVITLDEVLLVFVLDDDVLLVVDVDNGGVAVAGQ